VWRPWRSATALTAESASGGTNPNTTEEQVGSVALAAMDNDGDGTASLEEVEAFAKEQGLDYASSLAEFAGFDQNKDGVLDSKELGQAVSSGESAGGGVPVPRATLCGGIACGFPSVCCHGICGAPNAICCGKLVCDANATCCPGVAPDIHLCCHPGARCCAGVCLVQTTPCRVGAQFLH
jgi:hypothetical protein